MLKPLISTENTAYEEWLQWRKSGIGGSDASIICGINKYKSPVELWMEKTDRIEPQEAGESAYWGHILEPIIREEFTKRTGFNVSTVPYMLQHPEYPFMLANLDGFISDSVNGPCIFEAKTSSEYLADEWDGTIPEAYRLQIQHYMAVTGLDGTYIAALIGGNKFIWHYIPRDDELITMIIELESDFWHYVETDTPPPYDGSKASTELLNRLYPHGQPTSIVLPDDSVELIKAYEQYTEQEKAAMLSKDKAANQLKALLGENEHGIIGERTIVWKTIETDRLDTAALKTNHPELYDKYLKHSNYRRFSVK